MDRVLTRVCQAAVFSLLLWPHLVLAQSVTGVSVIHLGGNDEVLDADLSPDGTQIVIAVRQCEKPFPEPCTREIQLLNLKDRAVVQRRSFANIARQAEAHTRYSADGQVLVVAIGDGKIWVLDASNLSAKRSLDARLGSKTVADVEQESIARYESVVAPHSPPNPGRPPRRPRPPSIWAVDLARDRPLLLVHLAVGYGSSVLTMFDWDTGEMVHEWAVPDHHRPLLRDLPSGPSSEGLLASIAPDGRVAVAFPFGRKAEVGFYSIFIMRAGEAEPVGKIQAWRYTVGQAGAVRFADNDRIVLAEDRAPAVFSNSYIRVFDAATGERIAEFKLRGTEIQWPIYLSKDTRVLAASTSKLNRTWDYEGMGWERINTRFHFWKLDDSKSLGSSPELPPNASMLRLDGAGRRAIAYAYEENKIYFFQMQ